MLHLTGITPALSTQTREIFARFLQEARERQVPLSFDVNYRARLWSAAEAAAGIEQACRQATVLFCTADDAAELWGFTGEPEAVLHNLSRTFDTGQGKKTIVLTRGEKGSLFSCPDYRFLRASHSGRISL